MVQQVVARCVSKAARAGAGEQRVRRAMLLKRELVSGAGTLRAWVSSMGGEHAWWHGKHRRTVQGQAASLVFDVVPSWVSESKC